MFIILHNKTSIDLPTVQDTDPLARLSSHGPALLHLLDDVESRHHGAEHHVLPVQPLK